MLPAQLEGSVLDAQLELEDGRILVFITDGSPYDEGLHVFLLTSAGEVIDTLEAGHAFAAGILTVDRLGPAWVEVTFFKNDVRYRIDVSETARLHLSLPAGWRYTRWLRRHRLSVSQVRDGGSHG
jgi:hypothetical protein